MFIKILDREAALELERRGFIFTKENFNKNLVIYAFEKTPELDAVLSEKFSAVEKIEEDTLRFGGCV